MNRFSSAMSCYILAQRRVRSTWGSPFLINSLSHKSQLSGMIWLQRWWWQNSNLLCEVSLVDVEDGDHNGNDQEHKLSILRSHAGSILGSLDRSHKTDLPRDTVSLSVIAPLSPISICHSWRTFKAALNTNCTFIIVYWNFLVVDSNSSNSCS